jgi:hypothetical protein
MGSDITIQHHGRDIAFLTFVRGLPVLNADRVGSGFTLRLPALVHTISVLSGQPRLLISNLRGEVMVKDSAGTTTQVGRLRGDQWVTGYTHRPQDESYRSENEIGLVWSGTFADLALVERARDGRPPTLLINLKGEYCFLVPYPNLDHLLRSEPQPLYSNRGQIEVSYPWEAWVEMLRRLGVAENVLVEIPLPGQSADPRWDAVWEALVGARRAFEQGGSSGWQSCVVQVRRALELWRDIEPMNTGSSAVRQRSKLERYNNLRQALYESTHNFIHPQDEATRDDALLLLATLSALLAERKP